MLIIKNLTKKYGDFKAVDNISFNIDPGSITGFIGHNGAGKTTTLKSIAGIISFEEGEIFINGKNIKENEIESKMITAFIPDNPDIYTFLTGIKYLEFISSVYKISKDKSLELISKYSKDLGIEGDLGSVISTYSHGMRQKLVIISALIRSPKLLILDEPFVGLDPVSTHKLKSYLKKLCESGSSVIFSTHVLEVAQNLCDNVIIIKNAKVVAQGRMEDLIGDSSLERVFLELEGEEL